MRRLILFCVRDSKADAFLRPFSAETVGLAIRGFSDACNEPGHEFNKHATDYSLWRVGEFDVDTGVIAPEAPEIIGQAVSYKQELGGPDIPAIKQVRRNA